LSGLAGPASVLALVACGEPSQPSQPAQRPSEPSARPAEQIAERPVVPVDPPSIAAYEPAAAEEYPNAKRLAGRTAQRIVTYPRGSSAIQVARRAVAGASDRRDLARRLAPVVRTGRRSWGEVLYVQLSGMSAQTLGAMVVVRQRTEDARGRREETTRVVDVRLQREGAGWAFDRLGSVGGTPAPRPARLSPVARRVLQHPAIWLSDTSRWDIYRGQVDPSLLARLAQVADRWPISVTTLRTGHPENVWDTARVSAHTRGAAADIYSVAGLAVIRQRRPGSPAYALASSLVSDGAAQVGSPWVLGSGGRRSFTDKVHQDHLHLQQRRLP
jgi:hypothetical protein